MPSNPMQRKARNSFLIGVLVTTIVMGAIIGLLLFKMKKQQDEQKKKESAVKAVYVLTADCTAGENISAKLSKKSVQIDLAPTNALDETTYLTKVDADTVAKINLKTGTIVTDEMVVQSDNVVSNDTREQELNMIVLPTYLEQDDYIDIRLSLPSGEDFIVVSKKKIVDSNESTMWINCTEDETLILSNAIVESYQILGSKLYAVRYVEPGLQDTASVTYVPSNAVINLINSDPNIVEKAKTELANRINNLYKYRTDVINSALNANSEDAQGNIQSGVATSVETQKEQRSNYIKELDAAGTVN